MWQSGHRAFGKAGGDTFVLASPDGNMVWTCDNNVIEQLYNMHPKVEVPVEDFSFFELYGPTVFTVQGEHWKMHRRAITSGLGSAIDKGVWEESQNQIESLVDRWRKQQDSVVSAVQKDTSTLALHVIANKFYGMPMNWKDVDKNDSVPSGHLLPFSKALFDTVGHLAMLFMLPKSVLKLLPGAEFHKAYLGFTELTKYIKDLQRKAADNMEELTHKRNRTLLADPEITGKKQLSNDSVTGNIFFTMVAGHETTGNTLGFIFILMAIYPELQRKLQAELDEQFGDRPRSEWSYEQDFKTLQRGYAGAIQKEALHLYDPAGFTMRKSIEPIVLVDSLGERHSVPKDTILLINNAASNHKPSRQKLRPGVTPERFVALSRSPALYFNPERWLGLDDMADKRGKAAGSLPNFHPFGSGARTCPGRGFAHTEMTSVIATLFKDYSLELVVDDSTLRATGGNETLAHEAVRDKAIKMLYDEVKSNLVIALEKEPLLRIVPRASA